MITIETLPSGDWAFLPDGSLSVISGEQAAGQTAEEFVRTLRGELIFRADRGIRWDVILGPGVNASLAESYIRTRLLEVPGVVAVPALEVTISNNLLVYTASIETIYGEAALNGSI